VRSRLPQRTQLGVRTRARRSRGTTRAGVPGGPGVPRAQAWPGGPGRPRAERTCRSDVSTRRACSPVRSARPHPKSAPREWSRFRRWRATARWPGPRGGTSDAAAGRTMARASGPPGAPGLGMNRAPVRPPRTGRLNVARTCVLIKTASHAVRTCVLITCMSQASHGPWPRSDVIPWCRQNGRNALLGTVCGPVTCRDRRGGSAASHRGSAGAPAGRAGRVWRPQAERAWPALTRRASPPLTRRAWRPPTARPCRTHAGRTWPRTGHARPAAGAGVPAAEPRLSRSLLVAKARPRGAAAGSARPRPTNPRAPC
jgi:hypothetical protein